MTLVPLRVSLSKERKTMIVWIRRHEYKSTSRPDPHPCRRIKPSSTSETAPFPPTNEHRTPTIHPRRIIHRIDTTSSSSFTATEHSELDVHTRFQIGERSRSIPATPQNCLEMSATASKDRRRHLQSILASTAVGSYTCEPLGTSSQGSCRDRSYTLNITKHQFCSKIPSETPR